MLSIVHVYKESDGLQKKSKRRSIATYIVISTQWKSTNIVPGNEASPDGDVVVKKGYIVYLHYGHWKLRSPGMQSVSEYLAYHHNLTIVELDPDVDNQYIAISALQTLTILVPLGCNL
jgi:hypothetical protein